MRAFPWVLSKSTYVLRRRGGSELRRSRLVLSPQASCGRAVLLKHDALSGLLAVHAGSARGSDDSSVNSLNYFLTSFTYLLTYLLYLL